MARICGVCKQGVREGEEPRPIRLSDADAEALKVEAGLYSACRDCTEAHRVRVAKRAKVKPAQVSNHDLC